MRLAPSSKDQAKFGGAIWPHALTMALGAAAVAYLLFKTWQVAALPGYDFKYLWVAGKMWVDGATPYQDEYRTIAASLIEEGHAPPLWVYPPNWWAICTFLGLFDLNTAGVVWNVLNVAMTLGASVLLAQAFAAAFSDSPRATALSALALGNQWTLIFLHWFFVAVLEATAIVLSTGQTSSLIYLGVALTLYGLVKERGTWTIAGLVMLFLKPQIGAVFGIAMLLYGPRERTFALLAAGISLLISIPAFIVEPQVLSTFLSNIGRYDEFAVANAPDETTGLRLLVWAVAGMSIGSFTALGVTIAIVLGCLWYWRRAELSGPERAWRTTWLVVGAVLATAPLHYYDYVLEGCLVFALLLARSWRLPVALLGVLLTLRSDQLAALTGWRLPESTIFEGSLLATIGILLICFALIDAFRAAPAAKSLTPA